MNILEKHTSSLLNPATFTIKKVHAIWDVSIFKRGNAFNITLLDKKDQRIVTIIEK